MLLLSRGLRERVAADLSTGRGVRDDGAYDKYLRSFAVSVRDFGKPVVIGFGHEINATWYSWGYEHASPRTFVAAWRHIVRLFRAQGPTTSPGSG